METTFKKIEFWGATSIVLLIILPYLDTTYSNQDSDYQNMLSRPFKEKGVPYSFYVNYLFPELIRYISLYLSFIFLNFYVIPHYFKTKSYTSTVTYTVLTCLFLLGCLTLADVMHHPSNVYSNRNTVYYFLHQNIFGVLFISGIFFLYSLTRKFIISYITSQETQKTLFSKVLRDMVIATIIWGGILILLIGNISKTRAAADFWVSIIPYSFFFFELNTYWLLPKAEAIKSNSINLFFKVLIFSLLLYVPFGLFYLATENSHELFLFFIIWICSLIILVPISRFVYSMNKEHYLELLNLKKALKTTTSNLQLLRSQINPHFLFNALNTLYGTALQEKSDRTAQGIQRLGDMMRFMLHENNQDTILLGREIDYIRNYIDLQLLRTQTSPDILVETEIRDMLDNQYIAPMLLIPFIENAFKHGISLTHRSWIKITLHTDEGKLYFDVHNSIHHHSGTDPEKDKSGIGLENVKQRLQLIYPDNHELVIRETPQEFFIHLTVNL